MKNSSPKASQLQYVTKTDKIETTLLHDARSGTNSLIPETTCKRYTDSNM